MPQIKLIDQQRRDYACNVIQGTPDGWFVRVTPPSRSLDQNNLMWPLLTDLANQVEWQVDGKLGKITKEDWKDIMTASLKREQRIAAGADGGFVILGQRTSKMGKAEFSDLITIIRAFGDQRGVVWSDPVPEYAR
jgi:hypothetical protein